MGLVRRGSRACQVRIGDRVAWDRCPGSAQRPGGGRRPLRGACCRQPRSRGDRRLGGRGPSDKEAVQARSGSPARRYAHRYVPQVGVTKSRFGLATGPCRLLQRGSLYGRDTPDQREDCAPSLRLARLKRKPTTDFLAQYFIGRYVTSIASMRWAVVLTSLSHAEYKDHFLGDERLSACPQFFACHPSVHEPHVGAGTVEEAAMGCWPQQQTDLRTFPLVAGLKGGYQNVAQLALSLMGFCRDLGPMQSAQRQELMAIAGAIPSRLLRADAADEIQGWAQVSRPAPKPLWASPSRVALVSSPQDADQNLHPATDSVISHQADPGSTGPSGRRGIKPADR